jgi:hypothetical protein
MRHLWQPKLAIFIDIKSPQSRLLKVCYVPTTSAGLNRVLFLLQPLTVLMKQTRQVVCAIKQPILLRRLWLFSCIDSSIFLSFILIFNALHYLGLPYLGLTYIDLTYIGLPYLVLTYFGLTYLGLTMWLDLL